MARAAGGAGRVDAGLRKEEEEMIPTTVTGREWERSRGAGWTDGWMDTRMGGGKQMGWGGRMGNNTQGNQHVPTEGTRVGAFLSLMSLSLL